MSTHTLPRLTAGDIIEFSTASGHIFRFSVDAVTIDAWIDRDANERRMTTVDMRPTRAKFQRPYSLDAADRNQPQEG